MMTTLYFLTGCNGAGKTTAAFTLLPGLLDCREFVNADEIARGLSPFQPETGSRAGRRLAHSAQRQADEWGEFVTRGGEAAIGECTLALR